MVGVISKPINFKENTAMAIKSPLPPIGKIPPPAVILAKDQLPLKKKVPATTREITIILKKKTFASMPVSRILKLERIYQTKTTPIAKYGEKAVYVKFLPPPD